MPNNIAKSYAISDAKIVFVSLVDKAANKREFLITKSEGDNAEFQTYGRILKADAETHYVTGIVYEPMVEDTDGNYMTEEEITKAAHWFMKNSGDADIQHCFEKAENVEVVESYVAKSDMEIEGQQIKKGTWLMTMEISDDDVWGRIEKGEITGFSMGGKGAYSEVDVDISDPDNPVEKTEKKGVLKRLAKMLGLHDVDVVEKGAVKDTYNRRIVNDNFWTAYYSLSDYLLETYNPDTGRYEPVHDESVIREALEDFNEIIVGLLADIDGVFKSIEKAG
ncbi:MAG: XkdF-like putative serine protease domain-containing protein [Clostridiales bacterium]|nr:XkdF-like putative serine protease domain-containing protein [Clostridiales bacterium]